MPAEQPDKAVLRQSRTACWQARDSFFDCLDKNSNVEKKCRKLKKRFESACPVSWVKHFEKKREQDSLKAQFVKKLDSEGAKPL